MPKTEDNSLVAQIKGVTKVDPKQVGDFKRVMTEEVIPEIEKIVEERRLKAAESRQWQLKC